MTFELDYENINELDVGEWPVIIELKDATGLSKEYSFFIIIQPLYNFEVNNQT